MDEKESLEATQVQENEKVENTAISTKEDLSVEKETDTKSKIDNFTQEQVNEIVRARLDKAQQRLFNRYGVKSRDELDTLIGKSQSYDVMKERYDGFKEKNGELEKELAFLKNNINPEKRDDILAYFKGREIDFTNDNLANELSSHPEWLNPVKKENEPPKTTIETLGSEKFEKPATDEKEEVAKMFGLSGFVR